MLLNFKLTSLSVLLNILLNVKFAHSSNFETNCSSLQMGQYVCPNTEIDPLTQEIRGCGQNNFAPSIKFSMFLTLPSAQT